MSRLLRPIDAAWLAAFRIGFGAVLATSMLRFLAYGWVQRLFVEPTFHFKYWGFEWIEPLSGGGMHALFVALFALSLAIAAGFAFRLSAPLFALGLAYVQLIDVSTYLNHYYLAFLLASLLAVSPAQRLWSLDALLARRSATWGRLFVRAPGARVAAGWLGLFRLQVGVVYVFAGLAKAQPDWLLHAQPLRIWLGASTHLPVIGEWFTLGAVPLVLSWCGFLFDSTVVGFLSFRKTRAFAYVVLLVFHAMTRVLFPIGMFPVIMSLAALVFFEPEWPRTLARRALSLFGRGTPAAVAAPATTAASQVFSGRASLGQRVALGLGVAYCAVTLLVPLRFLAYGGNVLWHEQGMRFSWRVMVRAKGGSTTFFVREPRTGHTWQVSPRTYLTGLQESEMSSQPDLILQLAHHIRDDFARRGYRDVEVRADSRVALNGRRGVRMIDPAVDLVAIHDGLAPASWVLPAPAQSPVHTRPVL